MSAPKVMDSNPALALGGFGAVIVAGIVLLTSFGVPISDEQTIAIVGFVAAVGPFVTAVLIRRKVWSPASLAKVMPVHGGVGPADGDVDEEPGAHKRED